MPNTKTDARVKEYKAVLIPAPMHRKIKRLARREGLRLNDIVPQLLKTALK